MSKKLFYLIFSAVLFSCSPAVDKKPIESVDPLPSWNKGETKSAILDYVHSVTDTASPDFIAVPDRIATFDNDGNLWSEQPAYFQLFFAIDRVKVMAVDHPEWKDLQPFKPYWIMIWMN